MQVLESQDVIMPSIEAADKIPHELQCMSRNLATNVCLNLNCSSFVFLCKDKTCECYQQHKGCIKGSIQSIHQALLEKLTIIEPFQKRIDQLIYKAIDQLSIFREKIIQKAREDLNYIGLTQNQRKFMKAVKTKKPYQLTGKQMNQILSTINHVNTFKEKMEKTQTQINQFWVSFEQSMKKTFSKVETFLETFIGNINLHFHQSALIKTKEQKIIMVGFLGRQINYTSLLYRASENQFKISAFFQKCKDRKNTLIICETQYGKIIGGFSVNTWQKRSSDQRWYDETGQSFIFSLTNSDKFVLTDRNYAFRYYKGYGPMFGNYDGTDFSICDKANTERNSGANINNGYWNSKYTRQNKDSWNMFCGNAENFRFLIKEWQVWQIKFDQVNKK